MKDSLVGGKPCSRHLQFALASAVCTGKQGGAAHRREQALWQVQQRRGGRRARVRMPILQQRWRLGAGGPGRGARQLLLVGRRREGEGVVRGGGHEGGRGLRAERRRERRVAEVADARRAQRARARARQQRVPCAAQSPGCSDSHVQRCHADNLARPLPVRLTTQSPPEAAFTRMSSREAHNIYFGQTATPQHGRGPLSHIRYISDADIDSI